MIPIKTKFNINKKSTFIIILTFIFCLNITLFTSCDRENFLEVHVIDVDQGDACLIVTPEKKSILVDAGKEKFARNVIREIKKSNVKKLDYVIGTHYDEDHIGGINIVLKEFKTDLVLFPIDESLPPELTEILYLCRLNRITTKKIKADSTLKIDEKTKIYVLSPEKQYEDSNQNSIVFILEYEKNFLMFTGDADETIEKNIVEKYNLPICKFLKVGHHGSKYSSSEIFLNTILPEISTISCGYKNSYGHPHEDVLSRLKNVNSKIYRTDVNGTMIFYFNKNDVFTESEYVIGK